MISDLKPYSVLLMRPEYMSSQCGEDTTLVWVEATSASDAICLAQMDAFECDVPQDDRGDYDDNASDHYKAIAVFEGHLNDIKDAT